MKSASIVLSFVGVAIAQSITILSPPAGAILVPGSTVIVDIDSAGSSPSSRDVAVAIGLLICGKACPVASSGGILGDVLLTDTYSPQPRPATTQLFQNYTVQVPSAMQSGQAVLTVAHFYLLGAGAIPTVETVDTIVTIE